MASGDSLISFDPLAGRSPATGAAGIDVRNGTPVLDFAESVDERADFLGLLPSRYSGNGIAVRATWAATSATGGDVRWRIEFERRTATDTAHGLFELDADDFELAIDQTGPVPPTAGRITETAWSLTPAQTGGATGGDLFRIRVTRVGSDASDTASGDTELVALEISEA